MMQVSAVSVAAPDRPVNEDLFFRFGDLVGVLDGASVPAGFETGCVHGPAWYVRRLAARLAVAAADHPTGTLPDLLALAIRAVRADHGDRCDLGHPGTPSATACLLRAGADQVDYLVLCDSPLVVDHGTVTSVIRDDRLDRLMIEVRRGVLATAAPDKRGDPHADFRRSVRLQRAYMNQPEGYWVAAADPDAAHHAVVGSFPRGGDDRVRRAALLSDGAAYAVDGLELLDWPALLDLLADAGPGELVRRVRAGEAADGGPARRHKRYDDATAAICLFDVDPPSDTARLTPGWDPDWRHRR